MNVFYWNCRSIVNKLSCLQTYIYSSNFHVLALSETWLSSRILDKEIVPFGYTIYRSDRESRGGGVLVCTSHTTPSRLIKSHSSIDMVSIEILSSPSIVFCCVYIPPGCADSHFISVVHAIDDLALSFERLIIVGDFNLRDVNWQCLSASTHLSNVFCDLIFQHNLSQLIQMPTHIKGNTLDLLITNIDNHTTNLSVTPSIKNLSNFGFSSDHSSITFSVDTTIYSDKKKYRYSCMSLTSARLILRALTTTFWILTSPHLIFNLHVITFGLTLNSLSCLPVLSLFQKSSLKLSSPRNGLIPLFGTSFTVFTLLGVKIKNLHHPPS